MNEVIFKFISGLDRDEDFEISPMDISNSKQTTAIKFQGSNKSGYATFQ
jgi:hypothetical protein